MAAARGLAGSPLPAASFNDHADRLDNLGLACSVRRTSPFNVSPNFDALIPWQSEDFDTQGGGMWDAASPYWITITVPGTYLAVLQARFDYPSSGSPYNNGERAVKLLLNGTNVLANSVGSDKRAASVTGEGATLSTVRLMQCNAGDIILGSCWSSASATVAALQQNFGGSYLSVSYQAPLS